MPLYEYDCPACGVIEVMQKISEAALTECPQCLAAGQHNAVKKLVSCSAFHLKGSGWYKTDYNKSGGAGSSATSSRPATSASSDSSSKESSSTSESKESLKTVSAPAKTCGSGCGCH